MYNSVQKSMTEKRFEISGLNHKKYINIIHARRSIETI